VGSCLLPGLLQKHDVIVLDNLKGGYYGILPHLGNPRFTFRFGDVRDSRVVSNCLQGVDLVIHLAAIVGYPACKSNPDLAIAVNFRATKNLLKRCTVPFIFASTGSCYGAIGPKCTEDNPLKPVTEYGYTKMLAEREVQRYHDYIILRFSTGFGTSLRPRLDLLVNDFVMQAVHNKELIVFEKDYCRAFIHVKDMARAVLFSVANFDDMNREVFNTGSETLNLTKEEVALRIKKYTPFHLKFASFGHDPDKRNYYVSFKKIRSRGFHVKYNLDYGIKELIQTARVLDQDPRFYNNKVYV
jgi:nucleoside-diphosphate-sugar epimerase